MQYRKKIHYLAWILFSLPLLAFAFQGNRGQMRGQLQSARPNFQQNAGQIRQNVQENVQQNPGQIRQNVQDRALENRDNQLYYTYPVYPAYGSTYIIDGTDSGSYVNTVPSPATQAANPAATYPGPAQVWVPAQNGLVPDNSIVYLSDANGNKRYYCQVEYQNYIYQGVLVPNDGCYIQDQQQVTMRFTQYKVLKYQ